MNIETVTLAGKANAKVESNVVRTAVATEAVQSVARRAPTPEIVKAAAAQIESYLKSIGRSLDIRVDGDTGRMVVTVRNSETGETIRQIPSEEALRLAQSLSAGQIGAPVVFDETA